MSQKYFSKNLDNHTIEVRGSGTGSIDPWSQDFAHLINCSLMCTSDLGEFMRIDGDQIYKLSSFNLGHELCELLEAGVLESWDMFLKQWLNPLINTKQIKDWGSLKKSMEEIRKLKKKGNVWKTFDEAKKREVYEYLKTLSKEAVEAWYEEKFKELGI